MFSLSVPMSSALFATPAPESEAHPHKPLLLQLEQRGEKHHNSMIQFLPELLICNSFFKF